ncbi:MAG: hypothetical protein WKF42_06185 [Solirubrobacteraceae bacterium]
MPEPDDPEAETGAPSNDPGTAAPRRKVPAAGYAAPYAGAVQESAAPVVDLVTTTVQAASELGRIGVEVGRSALRSMFDRLPKP